MSRRRRKNKIRTSPPRGIYILPNLLTTASLFCGFLALIAATNGHFREAAYAILVSAVLDGLDGKIARLTKSTSQFGVQYDSLADLVAFGVAPAFAVYHWALTGFGRLGWIAAFLFVVCGALRLARFNIQIGTRDPRYFVGLPIPAAAAIVAATVLAFGSFGLQQSQTNLFCLILLYVLSFLMVSNLPYPSFKEVDLRRMRSFNFLVAAVLIFSVVAYEPVHMALAFLLAYLFSGPVLALWRLRRSSQPQGEFKEQPEAGDHF